MSVTQGQYITAKKTVEEIQRLPLEAQQAILNMLHGAIVISDMYGGMKTPPPEAERPGA